VHLAGYDYKLDYAWPERMLFLEYYGLPVHSGASAVAYDSRRQTALVAAGWRPIVFTDDTTDSEMVRTLHAVLTS
jgi:very-short-patch-repair endonuclease